MTPDSAFARLWRSFMLARVLIATMLLVLQGVQISHGAWHSEPILLCLGYLLLTVIVLLRVSPGVDRGFGLQWLLCIGSDIAVFAALQWVQQSINTIPLLALPVLQAATLGSLRLALGTASVVTWYLLGSAWYGEQVVGVGTFASYLQAGITSLGYFAVALLTTQLAQRLLREEALTRETQSVVRLQTQINELVIQDLSDGVLVVDPLYQVRVANPAAHALLGAELMPRALRVLVASTFDTGMAQQQDLLITRGEAEHRRLRAKTRLTTTTDTPPISMCVCFIEDIPELEAKLRQEKILAMGRMSTAVAHEIRNPLAAIAQANALLSEDLDAPPQQRQKLGQLIASNVDRLDRIVNDVLNIARIPQDQPGAGHLLLDAAVQAVFTDWCVHNQAAHKVTLQLTTPEQRVRFDAEHLRRILLNLLDNALRYSGQNPDSIIVKTLPMELSVWSDGKALNITVERHLFEPFFSSESRSSGLGLYICRELCERHSARLTYQRHNAGNSFVLRFAYPGVDLSNEQR